MTGLELLTAGALRGTLILAVAFGATALARRTSSAFRHFVWTAALAALLSLPAVMLVAPQWSWQTAPSTEVAATHPVVIQGVTEARTSASSPDPVRRIDWLLWAWGLGFTLAAARFVLGAVRTAWIVVSARPAGYAREAASELAGVLGIRRTVRVLETGEASVPMAWGVVRPVILLPPGADTWSRQRLRTVLLHELVHVRRCDLLSHTIGRIAASLFWFHPLAWLAFRRLREERERACDDAVLLRGVPAPDYAGHILELVRTLAEVRSPLPDAPAMAASCELEARVRALLDSERDRRPLSRRAALAVATIAVAVMAPVAVITAQAQAARGSLAGAVQDSSGGRVPQCEVVATNLNGPNQEVARTDDAGEYRFESIPAGRYGVELRARGFAPLKGEAVVAAGAAAVFSGALEIGTIKESMVITGSRPAGSAPAAAGAPQRIRVGGNVQATKLIKMVHPEYPAALQQSGVTGAVVMRAVVSTTGDLSNLEVINTEVNPGLAQAASDAVRQWRYQPTLLNGQPVEVVTTITVNYQLQ